MDKASLPNSPVGVDEYHKLFDTNTASNGSSSYRHRHQAGAQRPQSSAFENAHTSTAEQVSTSSMVEFDVS